MKKNTHPSYFTQMPSMQDIDSKMKKNGFSGNDLYSLLSEGVRRETLQHVAIAHDAKLKDVQDLLGKFKRNEYAKQVNTYLQFEMTQKLSDEEQELEKLDKSYAKEMSANPKLSSDKKELLEHLAKSGYGVRETAYKIILADRDLYLFNNDPAKIMQFYKVHQKKIDAMVSSRLEKENIDVDQVIWRNSRGDKLKNDVIQKVRFFVKQSAFEIMMDSRERSKTPEAQLKLGQEINNEKKVKELEKLEQEKAKVEMEIDR